MSKSTAARKADDGDWGQRRRDQAQGIRERAPRKGRTVYWLVRAIPFAALLTAAWLVAAIVGIGQRIKRFFTEDIREAPGKFKAGVEASGQELSSAKGRRALRRALFD